MSSESDYEDMPPVPPKVIPMEHPGFGETWMDFLEEPKEIKEVTLVERPGFGYATRIDIPEERNDKKIKDKSL